MGEIVQLSGAADSASAALRGGAEPGSKGFRGKADLDGERHDAAMPRPGTRRATGSWATGSSRLRGNSAWVISQEWRGGRTHVPEHPGCADCPGPLLRRCHCQHLLAPSDTGSGRWTRIEVPGLLNNG